MARVLDFMGLKLQARRLELVEVTCIDIVRLATVDRECWQGVHAQRHFVYHRANRRCQYRKVRAPGESTRFFAT